MKLVFTLCVGMASLSLQAQGLKKELRAEENPQVAFPKTVAAGNYSGITWLGGNTSFSQLRGAPRYDE